MSINARGLIVKEPQRRGSSPPLRSGYYPAS